MTFPGLSDPQSTAINDILGDATTALLNVNSKVESIVDTDLTNAASANTFGLLQVPERSGCRRRRG